MSQQHRNTHLLCLTKFLTMNKFKRVILLFGISIFLVNCQKESIDIPGETERESPVKRISLNELLPLLGNSEATDNLKSMFEANKTAQRGEIGRPVLLTDEIIQIEVDNMTFFLLKFVAQPFKMIL